MPTPNFSLFTSNRLEALADQLAVVIVNAAEQPVPVEVTIASRSNRLVDVLNPGDTFPVRQGLARIDPIWPHWGRILVAS